MTESVHPRDTLLSHLVRFAPAAKMFFSGTLCGVSPDDDGAFQPCIHLLSRGELHVLRGHQTTLRLQAPCVALIPRPLEHRVEGLGVDGVDLMCATLSDLAPPLSMVIPDLALLDLRSCQIAA